MNTVYLLVHHKVQDYEKWKKVFDEFEPVRIAHGGGSYHIFSREGDPNDLFLLFEWDSRENARKFQGLNELHEAMGRAGVVSIPDFHFLDEKARGALVNA